MNRKTAGVIGNKLGTYEGLDSKGKLSVGRFLRIRVKLNLHNPLKRMMKLLIEGEICEVHFRYERLPMHCYFCCRIGHGERDCEAKLDVMTVVSGEPQYGGWLRVGNEKAFSGHKLPSRTAAPPSRGGPPISVEDRNPNPKEAVIFESTDIQASDSSILIAIMILPINQKFKTATHRRTNRALISLLIKVNQSFQRNWFLITQRQHRQFPLLFP